MPIVIVGLLGLGAGTILGLQTGKIVQAVIIGGVVFFVLKNQRVI